MSRDELIDLRARTNKEILLILLERQQEMKEAIQEFKHSTTGELEKLKEKDALQDAISTELKVDINKSAQKLILFGWVGAFLLSMLGQYVINLL